MHVLEQGVIQAASLPIFIVQRRWQETVEALPPPIDGLGPRYRRSRLFGASKCLGELVLAVHDCKIPNFAIFADAFPSLGTIAVQADVAGFPKACKIPEAKISAFDSTGGLAAPTTSLKHNGRNTNAPPRLATLPLKVLAFRPITRK